jgi:hypothetical protein
LGAACKRAFRAKQMVKAYKDLPIYLEAAPYQPSWSPNSQKEYELLECETDAIVHILTQDAK